MTSPTSPLENALVLALEAIEQVLRASASELTFATPEVVTPAGEAHTFTVTGLGDGILGISDSEGTLGGMIADHAAELAAAISDDLGAALDRDLTVTSTGSSPAAVEEFRTAVQVDVAGLPEPGVLWVSVDAGLGDRIADSVRERLESLSTEAPPQRPAPDPVEVLEAEFPQVGAAAPTAPNGHDLSLLSDVKLAITVELGRTTMRVRDLLELGAGSVVELDRSAGTPVDVLVNGTIVARGEVVVVDDELGVRVTEVVRQEAGATA
jgi:flagellar motor switch protein FliN/FliY